MEMGKSEQNRYILLCVMSTLLLISKTDFIIYDFILVLLSFPLLRRPVSFIPLLFVASWSQTFGVLGLGAFYYYYLLFIFSLFFSNKMDKEYVGKSSLTLAYLCFALWIILTMFKSVSHEMSYAIKLSITIVLVFVATNFRFNSSGYCNKCVLWISFTASFFFFYRSAFCPVEYVVETARSWGTEVETFTSIMEGVNPNSASPIVAILTIILLIECVKRHNPIYLIPSLLNMYTMVFLGSRTSFYAMAIVLAYYFFMFTKVSRRVKIIAIIVALLVMAFAIHFINTMDTHLADSVVEDEGSGRFVTWALLMVNVVPKYWLWGIGVGRENYDALGYSFDADNLYIDLLCQTGIVGFALFFYLLLFTIRKARQISKISNTTDYVYIILVGFIFFGVGESIFNTLLFWGTMLYVNSIIDLGQKRSPKPCLVDNKDS